MYEFDEFRVDTHLCKLHTGRPFLVAVVVLTLTHIIKSVVTGQAPVTLEWKKTIPQGKT